MEELIKLLRTLHLTLLNQAALFVQLGEVLDREEALIGAFSLSELEQVIVEKDQVVQRATKIEESRLQLLKRICFLISYDARGSLPTLKEFLLILAAYVDNVRGLVAEEIGVELADILEDFREASGGYLATFSSMAPRIYRNQQILRRVTANVARSRAIFEMEIDSSRQYESDGKTRTNTLPNKLRIRV